MARYRVKESFDAGKQAFEKGQEVDVSEVPAGYLGKFSLIVANKDVAADDSNGTGIHDDAGEGTGGQEKTLVVNPDRDELKKMAADMGITFPANISTAKLQELVNAKADEINSGNE